MERDGGVCARCERDANVVAEYTDSGFFKRYVGLGWEADHIVAVIEGGGACGLENFQTLCVPCHKLKTKEGRRRR